LAMCNIILAVIDMIQWVQISKREEEKIEMDRQFMTEYFEKMYENPISEAVKGDGSGGSCLPVAIGFWWFAYPEGK